MKTTLKTTIFSLLLLSLKPLISAGQAYLCGSDEDGCSNYRACACIPYDPIKSNQPYCLDFDSLRCQPLSQVPDCYSLFIFSNHGECLATIFQSSPRPACPVINRSFCDDNHIVVCHENGGFNSCH